jgi:hypothetical protein
LSYLILTRPPLAPRYTRYSLALLLALFLAFSTFTYFPPRIFLFEHFDLENTGKYGILDYEDNIRYFTQPPAP